MASHMTKSGRQYKGILTSLKCIIDKQTLEYKQLIRKETMAKHNDQQLLKIIGKMRTQRVREIFLDKISRNNTYSIPIDYQIQSESQKDHRRFFKAKGFNTNQYILSIIYLIDIIFTFVTFVLGTFFGLFDQFRQGSQANSALVVALICMAILITFLKVILMSLTQIIVDGIAYVFISDILLNFILNSIFIINLGYIAILILVLAYQHIVGIGVAIFLISFVKIFTLYQNLKVIQNNFINSFKKQQLFNLLKVGIFNIFFAHFIATVLFAMSKLDEQNNWITRASLQTQIWYVQYIYGYYWACTIMMTVGFGDLLPQTFRQAFIVSFIQLFSCIVLAYNISQIGSIITALRSMQAQYKRKYGIFRRMIKQDRIDQDLQKRIENYLKSELNIKQMFEFHQQAQLINQLPDVLRDDFITQANKSIFPQLPFFNNLQKITLLKFTRSFKGGIYYPGQYLSKCDDAKQQILILKTGKVGLAYRKYGSIRNGSIVQQLQIIKKQKQEEDGEITLKNVPILLNTNFLSRTKTQNYDIVAQTYSFAYELKVVDFLEAIKQSEIDSSHYFYIRDKHSLDDNQWQNIECEYCRNRFHFKFSCPKLHYLPVKGVIILKNSKLIQFQQLRDENRSRKRLRSQSCFNYRKTLFIPLQTSRNITISNRSYKTEEDKGKKQAGLLNIFQKKKQAEKPQQNKIQEFNHCSLHKTELQKALKIALDQALTGYKQEFWNLQIDKMYNFSNYFSKSNANNFDFTQIKYWSKPKSSTRKPESIQNGVLRNIMELSR